MKTSALNSNCGSFRIVTSLLAVALHLFPLFGCTGRSGERTDDAGSGRSPVVGGVFENSGFSQTGAPSHVSAADTSPGWNLQGQRLLLTGTVCQPDGTTPAPGVLLYYYQTNPEGRYLHKPEEPRSMTPNEQGQTHGYIRGWVKTDANGRYWIYTVRPGTYPSRDFPAHVHVTVKEPNTINEYYIDDFVFDDDRLLTSAYRQRQEGRGGSGVLRLVQRGGLHIGERNIILGLNIPGHPGNAASGRTSGKSIGEEVFSFTPYHAWGADKGSRACPVCKYGWFHGILYCVGNKPDWAEIRQWLKFLEDESITRGDRLKVFLVYGNEKEYARPARERILEEIGRELKLTHVALTFVPSFADTESDVHLNRIDPEVENTFIMFRRSTVVGNFVALKPTKDNFALITRRLDSTTTEYDELPGAGPGAH